MILGRSRYLIKSFGSRIQNFRCFSNQIEFKEDFDVDAIDYTKDSQEEALEAALAALKKQTPSKVHERKVDEQGRAYGTGRRKTAVARVWIKEGSGQFTVNGKPIIDYFHPEYRVDIMESFLVSKTAGQFDVLSTVKGGGHSGQAGAIRLGISRALLAFNPEVKQSLRLAGFLTRDPRRVERKKVGRKKARKAFQWVKR